MRKVRFAAWVIALAALAGGCGGTESTPFTPSDIGGGNPMAGAMAGSTTGTAGNTSGAGTAGSGSSTGGTTGQSCPSDDHTNQGQIVDGDDTFNVSQVTGGAVFDPTYVGGTGPAGVACATADDCAPTACNCGAPTSYSFEAAACVGGVCVGSADTCDAAVEADICLCN